MTAPPLLRKRLTDLIFRHSSFECKHRLAFSFPYSTDSKKHSSNAITVSEFLMRNHHFSPENASRIGSVLPQLKSFENADSILLFLRESGLSNAQLEKTVKYYPSVLLASLEDTIKPKIRIFQDLGFDAAEIAGVVSGKAKVLRFTSNRIVSVLSVLQGLRLPNVAAANFLRLSMHLGNLKNTLVPNVEFMKSCGVQEERINWVIKNDPSFLLLKPETMRKLVEKIDELRVDRSSGMFIHALRVAFRMTNETWELKLRTLRELGFSETDILSVFRSAPTVLGASVEKMREVTGVLLETGKYDIMCIINSPIVFTYSVEKRCKPRLQVLKALEKKNMIIKWPALGTLLFITDAKFFLTFVAPYSDEIRELWRTLSGRGDQVKLEGKSK